MGSLLLSGRRRGAWLAATFTLVTVAGRPLHAQQPARDSGRSPLGRVRGVVYDSLLRQPLEGASVSVPGLSPTARTDRSGSYILDSIPAGKHFLTFSHPALDSVGLTVLGAVVRVAADSEVRAALGTPSLRTLYERLCGRAPPRGAERGGAVRGRAPGDSGIIFGVISEADSGGRLDGAHVVASWLALDQVADRRLKVSVPVVTVETDSLGAYRACGVATGMLVTVQASGGPYASGETEVTLDPRRPLARHDLRVGRNLTGPAADDSVDRPTGDGRAPVILRGTATLVGIVLDTLALPRHGARVTVSGTAASHTTDSTGRFRLTGLPAGSHTLEVRSLGAALERQVVDLRSNDTSWVDVIMRPATLLREVRVSARMPVGADRNGFERRRRSGDGHYMTEEKMAGMPYLSGVFAQMPGVRIGTDRGLPVLRMRSGLASCEPYVFIDGVRAHADALIGNFRPVDLRGIEVYTRGAFAPADYFIDEKCGVVVAWTKAARW